MQEGDNSYLRMNSNCTRMRVRGFRALRAFLGLDSLVLGEGQILSQVKAMHQHAIAPASAGPSGDWPWTAAAGSTATLPALLPTFGAVADSEYFSHSPCAGGTPNPTTLFAHFLRHCTWGTGGTNYFTVAVDNDEKNMKFCSDSTFFHIFRVMFRTHRKTTEVRGRARGERREGARAAAELRGGGREGGARRDQDRGGRGPHVGIAMSGQFLKPLDIVCSVLLHVSF